MNKLPVVLLAFANDSDTGRRLIHLSRERDEIRRSLKIAVNNDLCEVEIIIDANFKNIVEAFRDKKLKDRISIFHFAGHANAFTLCFESLIGKPELVYKEGFAEFIGQQKNLKLVFLNGCDTDNHAIQLHKKGIPVVLSARRAINDEVAADMAIEFYKSLAADNDILKSFIEAEAIVKSKNKQLPIFTRGLGAKENGVQPPALGMSSISDENDFSKWHFSKYKNDPLYEFPLNKVRELPANPFVGLSEYTAENANVFWGRNDEIGKFFKLLGKADSTGWIACSGVKGVGKSSLLKAGVIPRIPNDYFYEIIELADLTSLKDFMGQIHKVHHKIRSIAKRRLLFVFGVTEENSSYLVEAKKILDQEDRDIILVVELPNPLLDLTAGIFNHYYNLKPLGKKGMDTIFFNLAENYPLKIQDEFQENITSILLSDASSGNSPLIQYVLSELWDYAKENNFEEPRLNLDLLNNWKKKGGFKKYIFHQLSIVRSEYLDSGLVFELMNVCASANYLNSYPSISDINDSFNIASEDLNSLIAQLKSGYLLSEPVHTGKKPFVQLKLYNSVLALPLTEITDNSFRPAQKVRRICESHNRPESLFNKKQVELISLNWNWIKSFNGQVQTLYEDSKLYYQIQDKKKSALKCFQVVLCFIILIGGIFLNSPYLLMFLILVFVLYIY